MQGTIWFSAIRQPARQLLPMTLPKHLLQSAQVSTLFCCTAFLMKHLRCLQTCIRSKRRGEQTKGQQSFTCRWLDWQGAHNAMSCSVYESDCTGLVPCRDPEKCSARLNTRQFHSVQLQSQTVCMYRRGDCAAASVRALRMGHRGQDVCLRRQCF